MLTKEAIFKNIQLLATPGHESERVHDANNNFPHLLTSN